MQVEQIKLIKKYFFQWQFTLLNNFSLYCVSTNKILKYCARTLFFCVFLVVEHKKHIKPKNWKFWVILIVKLKIFFSCGRTKKTWGRTGKFLLVVVHLSHFCNTLLVTEKTSSEKLTHSFFAPSHLSIFATSSYQLMLWLFVKLLIELRNQIFDLN